MAALSGLAVDMDEREQLLHRKYGKKERYVPPEGEWDSNLPYGGKVFMARKRKPDPWWVRICEVSFWRQNRVSASPSSFRHI